MQTLSSGLQLLSLPTRPGIFKSLLTLKYLLGAEEHETAIREAWGPLSCPALLGDDGQVASPLLESQKQEKGQPGCRSNWVFRHPGGSQGSRLVAGHRAVLKPDLGPSPGFSLDQEMTQFAHL